MSGLIGWAGSKSGVIGETELDVEEGEWIPTNSGFDVVGSFTSGGKYVRIGKMVWISAWVKGATSIATSGGASTVCGNLPFTIVGANAICPHTALSGNMCKLGYSWNNNIYTIYPNDTYNSTTSNTEWQATSDGMTFAMQYEVA